MRYRSLGHSGLVVSRLVLGTTMFGELMDARGAREVVHAAWDQGVNAIDTADIYGHGRSEEIIGDIVKERRSACIVCTKVGFRVGDDVADHAAALAGRLDHSARWRRGISPNDQGLSRAHIISAVEGSLRRLQIENIDLYQIHRWDPAVPIEETLYALDQLIRSGKVSYIGCSNARGWQLYKSLWTSDQRGLAAFKSMQVPYSLLAQEAEQDALLACVDGCVGVIAYSVLAGGVLTGKHDGGIREGTVLAQRPAYQARYLTEPNRVRLARLKKLAAEWGQSQAQLALGFVLDHPAVCAATVGVQSPEELASLVAAVDNPLDRATIDALRKAFE